MEADALLATAEGLFSHGAFFDWATTTAVERYVDDLPAEVIRRHTRFLSEHRDYKARKRARPRASL